VFTPIARILARKLHKEEIFPREARKFLLLSLFRCANFLPLPKPAYLLHPDRYGP
jgi:hypothetical protein